jgi:hypothetical protein
MTRRKFRTASLTCLLALATLASPAPPARAQGAAVLPREQLQKLLDESETALNNLIYARDQPPAPALAFKRDKRGKGPADDLKASVLPVDIEAQLRASLGNATSDFRAGDLPGAQINLGQMRQGLRTQIDRYQAITEYWRESASLPYSEGAARKATFKTNGVDTPKQAEIETLTAQLDQQIASNDFVGAMRTTWPRLDELQKQARNAEYQQLIAKIDSDALKGFRSATPTRKCSSEDAKTSGTDTPIGRPDFPPINDYFPMSMKRQGIKSGTPEVFVLVNAQGCPERAVLVGPAEHEEFDDAGLRLAVDGRYLPADKAGKPVRGGFYMRMSFFLF